MSKIKITYRTKEESNKIQEEEFMKLSGAERFYKFLDLMLFMKQFPSKENSEDKKNNFVIVIDRS